MRSLSDLKLDSTGLENKTCGWTDRLDLPVKRSFYELCAKKVTTQRRTNLPGFISLLQNA
jgi:hypothetical protein